MNSPSFLFNNKIWGLRIVPLNPENPESAQLFSPVRRLPCGCEVFGLFLSRELLPPKSRQLPCSPGAGSIGRKKKRGIPVPDRSVNLALRSSLWF
ncbi:hypothetical protein SLEP1_g53368 [Rubroshorea leprosula]|uniref:Uncharacterized protein n=1 Tax=Rubroshorea leprosula TaxID=152421 RepID=A0AAV5M9C0_9ROSI|nr:hypothetical protein SLEP1_g53368 [Rubroshorea leprosula]